MKSRLLFRFTLSIVCGFAIANGVLAADIQPGDAAPKEHNETAAANPSVLGRNALLSAYQSLRRQLESAPVEESFNLQAHVFNELTTGEVYALMPYAYDFLTGTLTMPEQVCQAIVLHVNVKGCVAENPRSHPSMINLYFGRKEYQHPEDAIKMRYDFAVKDQSDAYTLISMTADKGPLSTANIAIHFEFLPVDAGTTFIHFAYSANYGDLARFALNTYLSTLGRNKVGFSEIGMNKRGEPLYIKGIKGAVERNTMRYFFALHSYFSTYHRPETQRFDASLNRWFDYVEKYPRQLLELPRDEYLEAKHKELRDAGDLAAGSKPS